MHAINSKGSGVGQGVLDLYTFSWLVGVFFSGQAFIDRLPLSVMSLIIYLQTCRLVYYILFLVFPFQTETEEEDKAIDIVEALDYEGSQAPSGETDSHEKIVDASITVLG